MGAYRKAALRRRPYPNEYRNFSAKKLDEIVLELCEEVVETGHWVHLRAHIEAVETVLEEKQS